MLRESNSRSIFITIRWKGISVMSTPHPSPPHESVRLDLSTRPWIPLRSLFAFKFALVFQFLNSVLQACPTIVECFDDIFVFYRFYAVDTIKLDFIYYPILLKQPYSHLFPVTANALVCQPVFFNAPFSSNSPSCIKFAISLSMKSL